MSKSTPLSQLPMTSDAASMFVNDQQRNIVQQAQQAQQTFSVPQSSQQTSSQIMPDVSADDDMMLQEMFKTLQQPGEMPPPQQVPAQSPPAPATSLHVPPAYDTMHTDQYYHMPAASQQGGLAWLTSFLPSMDDAQRILVVAAVIFAVGLVPFVSLAAKYVPVDKLPHADLLFKAIVASIVIYIVSKMRT